MATIYRCDRCGKESERANSVGKFNQEFDLDNDQIIIRADLCESCLRQLREWLKRLPDKAVAHV